MKKVIMMLVMLITTSLFAEWNCQSPWTDGDAALEIKAIHPAFGSNGGMVLGMRLSDGYLYKFAGVNFEQTKAMYAILQSVKSSGSKINIFRIPNTTSGHAYDFVEVVIID